MFTSFLFPQLLNDEGCLSLKLDQQGHIKAPLAQRSFDEIKTMQVNSQTTIVLPGLDCSLHQLALPWFGDKKARSVIPFALEDRLTQNFDTLHFAFDKSHYQNGHYLVVVIDKGYLQNIIAIFDEKAIPFNLITMDWFALKNNELAIMNRFTLVNNEFFQGALSADLSSFYVEKNNNGQKIYQFSDSNKILVNSPLSEIIEIQEPSSLWIAQRLQKAAPLNLCQGELQHGSNQTRTKRLYQAALIMSMLYLLSFVSLNSIKLYFLNQDLASLDAKIALSYHQFFPQAQQVISPRFRISQLIKANKSKTDLVFWQLLNALSKVTNEHLITIEELRFQNQTLIISLAAKDFAKLEELQTKLQHNQVKVKQTQASTRNDQVVSTLELKL